LGLFVIISFVWGYPALSSWANAREHLRHQGHIRASYAQQIQEHEASIEILSAPPASRILPYDDLTAAMADVQNLAQYYGLIVTRFDAAQPTGIYGSIDGDEDYIVELRITAAFVGERGDEFIYGLANSASFIRILNMNFEEDASIRVEFSLFGRR